MVGQIVARAQWYDGLVSSITGATGLRCVLSQRLIITGRQQIPNNGAMYLGPEALWDLLARNVLREFVELLSSWPLRVVGEAPQGSPETI